MEGEGRQGVDGALCDEHGVRPVELPRYPEAAAGERGWGGFAGAGGRSALSAGGDDLGAGRVPCGVSTDEHGIAVAVGVDQPEVAAQGEEHGRKAALVDEVAFHCGPVPLLRTRPPWAEALWGALLQSSPGC